MPGSLLSISRLALKPETFPWVFLLVFITFPDVSHSSRIPSGSGSSSPRACHVKFASKEDYVLPDTHIGLCLIIH